MHITCLALVPTHSFPISAGRGITGSRAPAAEAVPELQTRIFTKHFGTLPNPYTKIHSKSIQFPKKIPPPNRHCSSWCRNFLKDAEPGVQGQKIHPTNFLFFTVHQLVFFTNIAGWVTPFCPAHQHPGSKRPGASICRWWIGWCPKTLFQPFGGPTLPQR